MSDIKQKFECGCCIVYTNGPGEKLIYCENHTKKLNTLLDKVSELASELKNAEEELFKFRKAFYEKSSK